MNIHGADFGLTACHEFGFLHVRTVHGVHVCWRGKASMERLGSLEFQRQAAREDSWNPVNAFDVLGPMLS